jgi:hypothetical protein
MRVSSELQMLTSLTRVPQSDILQVFTGILQHKNHVPEPTGTMSKILSLVLIFFIPACTLLDRQSAPQILEVTTDHGPNPSVGRGREVNVMLFTEDGDNDELDFKWTASGGEFKTNKSDTLIDLFQDSVTVVWVAPAETGVYNLAVEITDGITGDVVADMLQISVTQGPPVAVLEPDRVVAFADALQVTLDATASTDPDDDQLKYFWRQLLGPAVLLESQNGPNPFFAPPGPADYVFELMVSDDLAPGMADTSDAVVVVIRVSDRRGRGG